MSNSVSREATKPVLYDAIAADYAKHRNIHGQLLGRLAEFCSTKPSPRVLEVGCGTGNYITALAAITPAPCSGVEPSGKMLDVARKKTSAVSWFQATAEPTQKE
jgi:ubiquinone/menaquinone biosynthesis C-methylase UbiE